MCWIGCLVIDRFPLACELEIHPELRGRPVVVTTGDPPWVWAASPEAERWGVRAEQVLREAISRCPGVEVVEGRPACYRPVTEGMLEALGRVVPAIEMASEGALLLDLGGMDRLHPDPTQLGALILQAVPGWLKPRVAISDGAFLASVIARAPGGAPVRVAFGTDARTALARAALEVLPASPETHRRLAVLGVRTLGEFARLPRSAVVAGLGGEGDRLWRLARGEDVDVLHPQPPPEAISVQEQLDEPIANQQTLLAHAQQLLTRLCNSSPFAGRAARQLALRCVTARGDELVRVLTFKIAAARAGTMWDVLRPTVLRLEVVAPIAEIHLRLSDIVAARGWQTDLDLDNRGREERLAEGLQKLRVQYGGQCPVAHFVEVEPWSRIPERRTALVDYTS